MKTTRRLIFELFVGIMLGILILYYALSRPSEQDKRNELKKENYSPSQIDSTIHNEDDDMFWGVMNLAG